ncbi:outer membrane beta-barrel protein [Flammeovirgaceae bacterium SG7u.111]|nr:outer membrane beta-barrel protein [Flammeovirgaceae bacterium SG7u.132]WPO36229.1 outer membrane beta-barrel protein [Flammeovirgaceae bacterium SG7u.111]
MKKLIPCLFLLFLTQLSFAQIEISYGPKVGIGASSVLIDDIKASDEHAFESLARSSKFTTFSTQFGLFANFTKDLQGFDYIFVQPEFYFSSLGGNVGYYDSLGVQTGERTIQSEQYSRIDFPVLVGYKFFGAKVYGGPLFSYFLSSGSSLNTDTDLEVERKFNSSGLGFQIGLGVDVDEWYLDLRYENMGNIEKETIVEGESFDLNTRLTQFALTVGYRFD